MSIPSPAALVNPIRSLFRSFQRLPRRMSALALAPLIAIAPPDASPREDVGIRKHGSSRTAVRPMHAERRPIRVLVLCDHVGFEDRLHGSGRQMAELSQAFDPARVQGFFYVLQREGELGRTLRESGAQLTFLGYSRFDPRQIATLARLIVRHDVDVVHAWDFGAATYGRLAANLTGRPAVLQVRCFHSPHQRRGLPSAVVLAHRMLAPSTARTVINTDSLRGFVTERFGLDPDRIRLVRNAVTVGDTTPDPVTVGALRRVYGIPENAPVIGAITRFFPVKGNVHLVRAFAQVAAKHPEARLLFVGDGPLRPELEIEAARLGVHERVIFAGAQTDVPTHLALCRVTALASLEEAFGNAAVESIVSGVPVVASAVGGLPEVIEDGATGLLVPPADPEPLAAALDRILSLPADEYQAWRERCVAQRVHYTRERMVAELEAVYREAVAAA